MLSIILNQLKSKAEALLAEEQADSELGGVHWNPSLTSESSLRNTCNTEVSYATASLTLRNALESVWHGGICLFFQSPYCRPSNDESWLGLDTSPESTL
ncbi:hypothetical protein DPMN_023474 [Dreissena polymorpha]|uniref:Uncharacterized protein n=1 Tax=Dreissena polymorpha TaxID=45954 RepID=A0A9D4LMB4_DREPO|nr:hypothetical protein DPMN_023474 [Dreissena polymorpha]